jgi:hypothetical protein
MFKIKVDEFLSHPFHTSAFVALFALLTFLPLIRPPFLVSFVLLLGLVYFSMYFGAVFKTQEPAKPEA